MTLFQALILGIVQGVTEFLPVSSSGHLILVPALFGWPQQPVAFDAITNWATLAALVVALWPDIKSLALSLVRPKETKERQVVWRIAVATIPALAFGFVFKDAIETTLRSPWVVISMLALWGVLLVIADRLVKKSAAGDITKVSWRQAIVIGCFQALALIPGTSRSGVTITTGLFAGLDRETAARFSFLLGMPAIAAGSAFASLDFVTGKAVFDLLPAVVAFLAAFISGIFAIRFLLKLMKASSYRWFGVYRIAVAVLAFFVLSRVA